ncbi:MAG TPA: 3-deoxy-D-manno-octulosonic acid transferase [Pirellulales bacterium]|jgi:3-deoxy-D-manno-octulosonic-acid transferase|nr:3-deoxy-D-manno-octulosonic acid transferase [Pirellulales bacterium]
MAYLLDACYLLALLLASPWLLWRSLRTGRYREGFAAKLLGLVPGRTGHEACVWLHAVSVGEVNLLGTLLTELAIERPDWQCVVSTTTQTGYALARRRYPDLTVFYCPLDFSWAVRRALRRIRPTLLVLAELELWPNLIRFASESGAKIAIINGRLSPRSYRGYRRLSWLIRPLVRRLDVIAAQNDEYSSRFLALGAGPETVRTTGSMKFDRAQTDRASPAVVRLQKLAGFAADDTVFLAGSTQEPEELLALDVFSRLREAHPKLRLVLVPRHPERFQGVAAKLVAAGVRWQRRTELDFSGPDPKARVLLVDSVGELSAWWGTARIGFVGGSLSSRGGQNMIEPAAFGVATSFGPNTQNFRDVVAALLSAEAAVQVADGEALFEFVRGSVEDPCHAAALGRRAQSFVAAQRGATRRTLDLLLPLADSPPARKAPSREAA